MTNRVLVTSVSRKVPLVKALQQAGFWVLGADTDPGVVARYFTDDFWPTPPDLTPAHIAEACQRWQLNAVLPTRDAELPFWASVPLPVFRAVSPPVALGRCLDKWRFATLLTAWNVPVVPVLPQPDSTGPWVVKPRWGAGGRETFLNVNTPTATRLLAENPGERVLQPYWPGPELSIDVYVSFQSGQTHGVVVRERVRVHHGESEVTRTTDQYPALAAQAARLAERLGLRGTVVFQALIYQGQPWFLECNPRFGGASTASIAAGLDMFHWLALEMAGQPLPPFAYQPVTLVRAPADLILLG